MDQEIKEEFNKVQEEFNKVNGRVDKVVEFLQTKVALKSDLEELESRITEKMMTKGDAKEIMNKLDQTITTQKNHNEEHAVINHRLDTVEAKVGIA